MALRVTAFLPPPVEPLLDDLPVAPEALDEFLGLILPDGLGGVARTVEELQLPAGQAVEEF